MLGDETARTSTAAALESARGLIRSEVGKQLGLRHTPSVSFYLDAVPESANQIEELLAKARVADAEVARSAANARPAGDTDPYRRRDEDEPDAE